MKSGVDIRKVDEQGRLILPPDWRGRELKDTKEVLVVRGEGYLKIVPRRRVNLTKFFDSVHLSVEAIGEWRKFESRFYGERD